MVRFQCYLPDKHTQMLRWGFKEKNGPLPEGGKPPRPIATPNDQVVKIGETARFHCDPNSDTPATIRWGYE
ncbi:unnamed protein product, partial [Wuchereria bancrofti]